MRSKHKSISDRTVARLQHVQSLLNQLAAQQEPQAVVVPGGVKPQATIVVLPGAFNPPTTAHVALVKQVYHYTRQHKAMQLYTALSLRTVDKEGLERPLLRDRILVLQTVLRRFRGTGILLLNRGLYVEQAEAIRRSFPGVRRIIFLMGYDKVLQIFDARYYTDRDAALTHLFSLARLLVVPRGAGGEQEVAALLRQEQNQPFASFVDIMPFEAAYRDVSATQIRESVDVSRHLIPREVGAFMRKTRAYAPPLRQRDGSLLDYYAEHVKYINELLEGER